MPIEIKVPTLGESIIEATVGKWLKHEGEQVAAGEVVVELETDKVSVEVTAPQAGVLGPIAHAEGQNVGIGDVLTTLVEGAVQPAQALETSPAPPTTESVTAPQSERPDTEPASATGKVVVSPVAQRIAQRVGLDPRNLTGSGPGGRITKDDVVAQAEQPAQAAPARPEHIQTAPKQAPSPGAPVASTAAGRPEERVRMSRRRQTIAARLVQAQQIAAMLTTFNEIDMGAVMDLRKKRKDSFKERHGVGLGFMSFFTKAVIGALRAQPLLNAEIQGDEIVIKKYYDIGIAVSTGEGLVVPVVRDADKKSFAEIERAIEELAKRARESKLSLSDLQGGSFTITNGGIFGSLMSTPILNIPQVGILGMHKIQERPMVVSGQIVVRPMMYVALSYDHRIVDGSEAVRFLVRVKELVEDPEALLLEG